MDERTGKQRTLWRWIGGLLLAALLVLVLVGIFNNDAIRPIAGRAVGLPVVVPDADLPIDPLDPRRVVAPDLPPALSEIDNRMIPVIDVVSAPQRFLGQEVSGLATVAYVDPGVPQERGIWIEQEGQRLLLILASEPRADQAIAVEPGDWLRLRGVVQPGPMAAQQLTGLNARARQMLSGQPAFLLVDPDHVAKVIDR